MSTFKFRADAALRWRRQQEDAAKVALANAERRVRQAAEAATRVRQQMVQAGARAREAESQPTAAVYAQWHRNWIKKQQRDLVRALEVVEQRRGEHREAERRVMAAHRDVRVLERLRDRALDRHQTQERRAEQQAMDLLGVMQYTIRQLGERT